MTDAILITGATGQVGSALVERFLERGWTVLAVSRKGGGREVSAAGRLIPVGADLAAPGGPERLAAELAALGRLPRALVNAARDAAHLKAGPDGAVAREQWLGELTVDVIAAYELATALRREGGATLRSIVNVSSIYGMVSPKPFLYEDPAWVPPIHYGVAKAALLHLTKELAARLAPAGVAVNAVSYGGVEGRSDEGFLRRYGAQTPAGRMLRAGDLADAVEFLAGRSDAMLTGQNLAVDGGWTLW